MKMMMAEGEVWWWWWLSPRCAGLGLAAKGKAGTLQNWGGRRPSPSPWKPTRPVRLPATHSYPYPPCPPCPPSFVVAPNCFYLGPSFAFRPRAASA
jgi:hypothetical protein